VPTVLELPPREARARWLLAARLLEHGLPVARPVRLTVGARRARMELDAGPAAGAELAGSELPLALGRLLGLLHDRGLDPGRLGPAELVPGAAVLALPTALRAVDPLALRGERFASVSEALGAAPPDAFRAAYLACFRDRPRERARITRLTE
jgi:hypothetical protein